MARKKKRDDLEPVPVNLPMVDPGRQPRILGWLVLIVGTASTWYWYRPLPPSVSEAINAVKANDWSSAPTSPKSLWTDEGLIVPSFSETDPATSFAPLLPPSEQPNIGQPNSGQPNSGQPVLVGTSGIALVPWQEPKSDLREVLKTERLPMVPIEPVIPQTNRSISKGSAFNGPAAWVPEPTLNGREQPQRNDKDANVWPDAGYVPESVKQRAALRAATQITTQIPPLLDSGARSIRTSESIEDAARNTNSAKDGGIKPTGESSGNGATSGRTPTFIRQPKK